MVNLLQPHCYKWKSTQAQGLSQMLHKPKWHVQMFCSLELQVIGWSYQCKETNRSRSPQTFTDCKKLRKYMWKAFSSPVTNIHYSALLGVCRKIKQVTHRCRKHHVVFCAQKQARHRLLHPNISFIYPKEKDQKWPWPDLENSIIIRLKIIMLMYAQLTFNEVIQWGMERYQNNWIFILGKKMNLDPTPQITQV